MRYTGPRNRLARREGVDLGLKTPGSKSHARLLKKLNVRPGQQGLKGKRKITEHATQLQEKQKLRYMFGLSEKQLKKYFTFSIKKKGNTAEHLSKFLEKRLDNVVYRLGFAPTRSSARQFVTHGHVKVNDKLVTIPSYQLRANDLVTLRDEKTTKIPYVEKSLANKDLLLPKWLDRKAITGKFLTEPTGDLIGQQINLRLVIEFYSR